MAYWRMQLHPSESNEAIRHTVESLSAGYVGLDFAGDVADLMTLTKLGLPENQRNYWAFAHEMQVDDRILLFAHHFPLALVRVSGNYNYIRSHAREIGVWFRHFRAIDDIRYYGDLVTNALLPPVLARIRSLYGKAADSVQSLGKSGPAGPGLEPQGGPWQLECRSECRSMGCRQRGCISTNEPISDVRISSRWSQRTKNWLSISVVPGAPGFSTWRPRADLRKPSVAPAWASILTW
jgi:hypothetical protein